MHRLFQILKHKWLMGLLAKKDLLLYIGGSEVLPPPLSSEEERRLAAMLVSGTEPAREEARVSLIEHNLRLVVYIARKFESAGVNMEDLISIGTIGLIKAVNTFNPEKNIKLATYASRCIENEILMFLRRNSRIRAEVSFDEPLNVDWDGNELLLSDILGTEEDEVYGHLEEEVNHKLLHYAMKKLTCREQQIMEMRFGLVSGKEMTQKEVADQMGISQSYISRLEKKIILRLQKEIRKLG
ncbi:MAG: RNA polymerase sporulation sigma factor SigE [Clostridiales bacterium]|nr:RNA polymerase sporulation sigma factor SigE [Clostridiales bacterium]